MSFFASATSRSSNWRLYAEEGLARQPVAVWLGNDGLSVEYGGQTLSVYDVELASETGKPTAVRSARLFETTYVLPQLRLFALEEAGWLTALKLEEYAPRRSSDPMALQEVLFPYLDAL